MERFSPEGNRREELNPMNDSRCYLAAAAEHNGLIYVSGGDDAVGNNSKRLDTVEMFEF